MRIAITTLGLVGLLLTGCTSLQPISSKPPESAIELKAPAKFPGFLYTVTFPAGVYRPLYEDSDGYYYQAPAKVIGHDIMSWNLCKSLETWFLNQASERYANDDQSPAWTFGQPDDRHADE